ncbi:Uncharacterized protein dnm_089330 [Desulfonema magnum]|uniref:Uncharacterized protein n=1 Tax=Desulfonema magnum TaxID=45655 RepID=A0A975BW08_9BACT|nr:Uncharacterized protein dnm_089330 [Desulfonema magnum]
MNQIQCLGILRTERDLSLSLQHYPKFQISNFKFQVSSFQSQVSNFKFQVSNFKFQIFYKF